MNTCEDAIKLGYHSPVIKCTHESLLNAKKLQYSRIMRGSPNVSHVAKPHLLVRPECGLVDSIGVVSPSYLNKAFEFQDGIVGKGAFGSVYAVKHLESNKIFALKLLNSRKEKIIVDDTEYLEFLEDLYQEVATLSQIQNDHVVRFCDVITNPETRMIGVIMELITGGELTTYAVSLSAEDRKSQFPRLFHDVMSGINAIHDVGITHRDIKPPNIMISRGRAMIVDFGISCGTKFCDIRDGYVYHGPVIISIGQGGLSTYKKEVYYSSDLWGVGISFLEFLNPTNTISRFMEMTMALGDQLDSGYTIENIEIETFFTVGDEIMPIPDSIVQKILPALMLSSSLSNAMSNWQTVQNSLLSYE